MPASGPGNPLGLPLLGPLLFELGSAMPSAAAVDPASVACRRAVRGVVQQGGQLLMVHSAMGGDFKFPGGGIEPGEDPEAALVREAAEECAAVVTPGAALGTVIEYHPDNQGGQLWVMASHYLLASYEGPADGQALDEYEAARGFRPAWISAVAASAANRAVLARGGHDRWVPRETRMLELLVTSQWLSPDAESAGSSTS